MRLKKANRGARRALNYRPPWRVVVGDRVLAVRVRFAGAIDNKLRSQIRDAGWRLRGGRT